MVGLNSDTSAALALSAINQSEVFSLFAIVSCQMEDAFSRTRQALAEAENVFFSTEGSASQKLQAALEIICQSLTEADNLQILLSATQAEREGVILYLLSKKGTLTALLDRPTSSSPLNLCGHSGEDYHLVSGLLKGQDRVILTTRSLIDLLGDDFLKLRNTPIEGLEDEIESHLPEAENFPVAAIFLEIKQPDEEKIDRLTTEDNPKMSRPPILLTTLKSLGGKLILKSKRGGMVLGIGLLIVILTGIVMTYYRQKDAGKEANYQKYYKLASQEYNQTLSIKDLDQAAALQSLARAKEAVSQALIIKPRSEETLKLKQQIEEISPTILKTFAIDDFLPWLDLDLVKKGFSASRLSLSYDNLLILDSTRKVLVKVNLKSKAAQILAGEDSLGKAELASINGDIAWVYSSDKGLARIDIKGGQAKAVIKPDSEWGEIEDLYGFAGNIYLLDKGNPPAGGRIWKYLPVENGYSDKRNYLKEGVRVDFTNIKRMQIDSSIWLLKENGDISKYTQGAVDFFSVGGLDKPLGSAPKSFFVSDQTDYLYLLDSSNNRLVVLDKKGAYQSQYQSDKFNQFTDLVVDEASKKVYLLLESKISQMDLR